MSEFKQNSDGSLSVVRESDSFEHDRVGGKAGPAGSSVPVRNGLGTLTFNIGGLTTGGTDAAGGLLAWQNLTGFDLLVQVSTLDLSSTASTTSTASFGSSTNSTGLSTTLMSGITLRSTNTTGSTVAAKVVNGNWITGSTAGGTSTGMIGRVHFTFTPVNATVGGA